MTNLHTKCKTVKLLEDKIENLNDLRYGNNFLDITQKTGSMKEMIGWTLLNVKLL